MGIIALYLRYLYERETFVEHNKFRARIIQRNQVVCGFQATLNYCKWIQAILEADTDYSIHNHSSRPNRRKHRTHRKPWKTSTNNAQPTRA